MNRSSRRITGVKAKLLSRLEQVRPDMAADIRSIKLPWYTIGNQYPTEDELLEPASSPPPKTDPEKDETDIFIFEEIGGSFGIEASQFVLDLQKIKTSTINVHINSPGGSVNDAIAIYNALILHPANIVTYVNAMAASSASIITMAGDRIVMMVGSQLMIHDAMSSELGNARELRELADWVDAQSDNLASIYANRAGRTTKFWRNKMLAETWAFAEESVTLGLADEVYARPGKQDEPPMPPDPEPDPPEDDEDTTHSEPIDVLQIRHVMTNRGFKYASRNKAPNPLGVTPVPTAVLDDSINSVAPDYAAAVRRAALLNIIRTNG